MKLRFQPACNLAGISKCKGLACYRHYWAREQAIAGNPPFFSPTL